MGQVQIGTGADFLPATSAAGDKRTAYLIKSINAGVRMMWFYWMVRKLQVVFAKMRLKST